MFCYIPTRFVFFLWMTAEPPLWLVCRSSCHSHSLVVSRSDASTRQGSYGTGGWIFGCIDIVLVLPTLERTTCHYRVFSGARFKPYAEREAEREGDVKGARSFLMWRTHTLVLL